MFSPKISGSLSVYPRTNHFYVGQETDGCLRINLESSLESCELKMYLIGTESTSWFDEKPKEKTEKNEEEVEENEEETEENEKENEENEEENEENEEEYEENEESKENKEEIKKNEESSTPQINLEKKGATYKFCKKEIWKTNFSEGLKYGNYDIPYQAFIPSNIPGSFDIKDRDSRMITCHIFSIEYKLRVVLLCHGKVVFSTYHKIFVKSVKEAWGEMVENEKEFQFHLNKIFGRNGGVCKFKVSLYNHCYTLDEIIKADVDIDNTESLVTVRGISYKLSCKVIYKDDIDQSELSWPIEVKNIVKDVKAGNNTESLINEKIFQLEINLSDHLDLLKGNFSTNTKYIKCVYTLSLEPLMGDSFMRGKIKNAAEIPIIIIPGHSYEHVEKKLPKSLNESQINLANNTLKQHYQKVKSFAEDMKKSMSDKNEEKKNSEKPEENKEKTQEKKNPEENKQNGEEDVPGCLVLLCFCFLTICKNDEEKKQETE